MTRLRSTARSVVRSIIPRPEPLTSDPGGHAFRGTINAPQDGSTVFPGRVEVVGWTLVDDAAATAVVVRVDGVPAALATLGLPRADVVKGLGPGVSAVAGWCADIEVGVASESAEITATAYAADGRYVGIGLARVSSRIPSSSGADAAVIHAYLSSPADYAVIESSVIVIAGSILFRDGPAARVSVTVDGGSPTLARLHTSGPADAPAVGFEHRLVVGGPPTTQKSVVIEVVAYSPSGHTHAFPAHHVKVTIPGVSDEDEARSRVLQARAATKRPVGSRTGLPRVLVVTHDLRLGGGQLYLQELLRQLSTLGTDVAAVVSPSDGALRQELEDIGIPVHITAGLIAPDVDEYEGRVRELASLARDIGASVAILNTVGTFLAADAMQRAGLATIWVIHESFPLADWMLLNIPDANLAAYSLRRAEAALAAASAVVFVADATSDMYAPYATVDHRITVPYGVDMLGIDRFRASFDRTAARKRHDIPQESTVLLCLGTVEPRKAQASLVEAFVEVVEDHSDLVLALVGDTQSRYSLGLRNRIQALGLSKSVRLVAVTADAYEWLGLSDLLISASDIESLPRSMLEAAAFDVPILATSVFGVPELLEDGRSGWLFEPRDFNALVTRLRQVLALSRDEWRMVADAAAQTVRNRLDAQGYGAAYSRLITGLAASPASLPREILADVVGRL